MTDVTLLGYIDPGSGFILLQVLLAGALGSVLFFQRVFWKMINLVTGRGQSNAAEKDKPQSQSAAESTSPSNMVVVNVFHGDGTLQSAAESTSPSNDRI